MKRDWFDLLEDYQAQPLTPGEGPPSPPPRLRQLTIK